MAVQPPSAIIVSMKKPKLVNGEFYHIYNRGVDKRNVFIDDYDLERFFQGMDEFNTVNPIGSLYESSFLDQSVRAKRKNKSLIKFIAYCLNPNHYHFILQQITDGGITEFMKRLNGGYTWYFNNKYKRSGALFQGRFKAVHVDTNKYLLHLSIYVNLNNLVHNLPLGGSTAKLSKSSWEEYGEGIKQFNFCSKDIILKQFKNRREYKQFAKSSLEDILERKEREKEVANLLLE